MCPHHVLLLEKRRDMAHKMTELCAKHDEKVEPDWLRQRDVKEE